MRHPIEKYNQIQAGPRQANRLAQLPEPEREFWARMYQIGNAAYCYQQQFNGVAGLPGADPATKLPDDLLAWLEAQIRLRQESRSANELLQIYFEDYLEGLPGRGTANERVREGERQRGLEEAKRSFPFRRYVLERNNFGQGEFMRLNLSDDDYAFYRSAGAVESGKP